MDRRAFLGTVAGSLLAAPLAGEAQQAGKVYRIGVVAAGVNPRSAPFFQAFEQRLRELGWLDGKNVAIDFEMPKGSRGISAIAADLVRQHVDVILAGGPEASLKAARRATSTIPIVMVALNYDPVAKGHVGSLARPGGNVTGVFSLAPEQGAKQLELLKEVVPRVALVGVLWDAFATDQLPILDASARKLNVELEKMEVRPEYDLEQAFLTLKQRQVGAVLIVGSPIFFRDQAKIAALALRHHLPAGGFVSGVAGGLLIGYAGAYDRLHALETAADAREFRFWSTIALSYGFGTPTKMQPEGDKRTGLIFSMVHGRFPWDPAVDPMREQTDKMIQAKQQREDLLALEEAKGEKPVVIDVKKDEPEPEGEPLESVTPPPEDPGAFSPSGSRR